MEPPRLLPAGLLILCLYFLAPAASANQCVVGCHGMRTSKGYDEGHTYTYEYEGSSVTSVSEAQGESNVKVNAIVELAVKPDCIHQLKLKNVRVNGAPVSQQDVEKYALQFNYHDGHIDTSICAESGDSQASLNIKRAIVSLFQSALTQENGVTSHRETDVFGSCQTDFEFRREGDALTIRKYRNLASCAHREYIRHGLIYAAFDEKSGIKASPLIDSQQKTEQIFKKGILNSVKSTETYNYRLFSNGDAGAKTIVQSTLTFKADKADGGAGASVSLPKSLVFEAPHPVADSSAETIANSLKQVKAVSGPDAIKDKAAEAFGEFVKVLRRSNKKDILSVYGRIKSGAGGFDKTSDKNILLDGLYRTGSGDATEVIVELIKNNELSKLQLLGFYASLALVDHVGLSAVTAVTSLLDQPNVPRVGYLGIGRVIGKYIEGHGGENVPEIQEALAKISAKIGDGKPGNREEENRVIAAIKALKNAKYLDEKTIDVLVKIAKDKTVHDRVRVSAIEAFPAKCSMKWKTPILEVFGDREEDSEIRIKSYLSLVACSCNLVANEIKKVLDKETVNQVGSFVTTHLRNLRASVDPSKETAKKHLGEVRTTNKFPEDFRKFSYNHEFSYDISALGVGSTVEENVIFSQKSWLPRSASLNLTTEIFGRSFNFLEIDTRVENLDRVIEHYFGPKGVLKTNEIKSLLSNSKKSVTDVYDQLKERAMKTGRGRRSVVSQSDLDNFAKTTKSQPSEVDEDLDIDLSIKLFGVELVYMDVRDNGKDPKFVIDRVFDFIDQVLNKAKSFDFSRSKHAHILDIDLVYPTGLGFPLSIGAEANAVTHIRTNGKVDLPAILKDPKNAAIKIGVEPSASIMVSANIIVNSFGADSGLKVIGRLHTATGSDLSVKLLDGNGIDISFGIPKRKQEIISLSSEVILIDLSGKKTTPKFAKGKEHSDCFEQFSAILGVTVCGDFAYPYENLESVTKKPVFPLTAPAKLSISIENTDATSYHFRTFYDKSKDTSRSLEILFETPNSRNNRKIALKVEGTNEPTQKFIKASFDSPIKKAEAEVRLDNTDKKKAVTVSLKHDTDEYYGAVGLVANGNKFKPILEYKVPEHIERLAGGKGGKAGEKSTYNIDGEIAVNDENSGKKYVFENVAVLAGGKKLVSVDGWIFVAPTQISADTKLAHSDESIQIKLDAKHSDAAGLDFKFGVVPSKDKQLGFKLAWISNPKPDNIESKFIVVYGADLDSKVNRFTYIDKISFKKNEQPAHRFAYFSTFNSETIMTWPAQDLDAKFISEITSAKFKTDFDFKYGKFKIGTDIDVKSDETNRKNIEIEFDAYLLENKVSASAKQKVIDENKRKLEAKLELPGAKYEAESTINYKVVGPNANIQFDGDFKINGKAMKLNYGLDATPEKISSNALVDVMGTKYLEFVLKAQRGQNPNGNVNLNVKNLLIVTGDFKYQTGKGNGVISIDIPKLQRKIKGSGDIAVSGTKHVGTLEILLDAERDPNKRIKISTDSDITKLTIDTKNSIDILNNKLEVNVKGSYIEKSNPKHGFDGDIEITLPNGMYLLAKGKSVVDRKADKTDILGQYEFNSHEKKGSPGRKLQYDYDISLREPRGSEFYGKHSLKFINSDGKDIDLNFKSKNILSTENPDKHSVELQVSAGGKYLPRKFDLDFNADHTTKKSISWKLDSKLGDDFIVNGNGHAMEAASPKEPRTSDVKLQIKLPFEKLSSIKYEGNGRSLVTDGDTDFQTTNSLTWNEDKNAKLEMQLKKSGFEKKGVKDIAGKLVLQVLDNPQIAVAASVKHDGTQDLKKGNAKVVVNFGEKEVSIETDAAYTVDFNSANFDIKATTPVEKFKKVEFGVNHKRENEGTIKSDIHFVADDKKYSMTSELDLNPSDRRINIVFMCPAGKSEYLAKVSKLGDNEYKGEWKVETPKGFVTADGHVRVDSIDNFIIDVNFDSDKLQQRKIHAKIATEPAVKNGNKIILTITSDGKNIVTGSTNYSKRDESGKIIVEGNGNLKIGENTRVSKFTYSRQQLTKANDGEAGVAILLNANFGPSAVVGELKLTDKEVHLFNSYCEQSKDCAHFKLQSTLDTDKETRVDHQITVEVDLKKFNLPVEFGLKTTTKYNPKEHNFDHTANLYLHTSKDKTQYSTQIYVHPKESAIVLTLPSRELALIASVELPKNKVPLGPYKIDLSAYLDRKNHPKDKTSFVASGDVQLEKNTASVSGEATFSYPQAPKDMTVKGKVHYGGEHLLDASVDIDVFAKKTQKIGMVARLIKTPITKGYNVTGSLEVNSRGQQLKVELKQHAAISASEIGFGSFLTYNDLNQKPKTAGVLFSVNAKEGHLLIQAPNKDLIKADSTMEFSKVLQKVDTEISVLQNPTIVISAELKDLNSFKYQSYEKEKPNTKLQVNARVVIGQLAEFHADAYKEGDKKPLMSVALYLDESRFLKPDFSYNKENVATLIDFYRQKIVKNAEQIKDEVKALNNEANVEFEDLFAHLKKASPDLKPMITYYQGELDKLKQELDADRTIQQIQATINKVFGGLIAAITDTIKQIAEKVGDLQKQFHEIQEKIMEGLKVTYPKVKESIDKILNASVEVLDAASKLGATYLKAILNVINEHQKELKELAGAISELVQDIVKIIMKGANQIEGEVKNFVTLTTQQIKALPIYDVIKAKWSEIVSYQIPEAILGPIEDVFVQIKKILPTEELREFFAVTYNYIIKHVKHQKIDEVAEIKNIWSHGIDAMQSIIALIQSKTTSEQFQGLLGAKLSSDFSLLKEIAGIPILRVSIVNLIRNRELPPVSQLYYTYRPTAHLSDIIPPFSHTGIVTEGGHFFTFDGRHVTLAGTCDYVLAQDTKDGNFTIVGTFNAGKLISVTVTAPGESITLKSNGNILVDNAAEEYPAGTKNLHAFLTLPIVNVKSNYGVHVACSQKAPMLCSIRVSGFYHGKLKGVLGNADNEPWDDFTMPNGHITESESEFGNAYRLNSKCEAAKQVDHHTHTRDPTCTEYFANSASSLSSCFNYVNPTNYRTACDHAVSAGTGQAACLISAAYYAACRAERVKVSIPATCTSCKIGKDNVAIGDSFSVVIPKKEADIVFVVEQEAKNEKVFKELITPLIVEVKNELKGQGFSDIHIGLIGFGEHMKWPQHYTTGGSINVDGEIKNMKFAAGEPLITFSEAKEGDPEKRLKYTKQRLNVELGTFKLTDAYEEAVHYPFRAGAAKVVVGVLSSPCEKSPLPLSLQHLRLFMGQKLYRDLGLTYHHVGYLDDVLIGGKPSKGVVGYDANSAYAFTDNKKKPLEGSLERKDLTLGSSDVCASFATSSGGAAYSSSNFLEAKPNQKKQFIQIAARRLAESLTSVEYDEDCSCQQQHGLDGYPSCKIIARKDRH